MEDENEKGILTTLLAYKEIILLGIIGLLFDILKFRDTLDLFYFSLIFLLVTLLLELLMPGISLRFSHAIIIFCIGPLLFSVLTARPEISLISISVVIPCLFVLKIVSFIHNPNDMALFMDKTLIYTEPFAYIDFLNKLFRTKYSI